jgi:hypothetical protein
MPIQIWCATYSDGHVDYNFKAPDAVDAARQAMEAAARRLDLTGSQTWVESLQLQHDEVVEPPGGLRLA